MRVPGADKRKLLLLSNSRDEAGRFLQHTRDHFADHFEGVRNLVFVPFAGVTISWDAYAHHVREAMKEHGIAVHSAHDATDPRELVENAEAIAVGGGNTFHLLANVQGAGLLELIRKKAMSGTPYLGWSAGSVIAAPTMKTTNDMPITQPESFNSLGLVGFQINAHFTDAHPPGFQGETRRQRLAEFVAANPTSSVIGLPEGTWLRVRGSSVKLHGQSDAAFFKAGMPDAIVHRDIELADVLEA